MSERTASNCIGFVFHQQGIIEQERFMSCPSYRELLRYFNRVPEIIFADIVAVVVPTGGGPGVLHLAVVNEDKQTITHRKGGNQPVETGLIEIELEDYVCWDEAEVVFLRRKQR